MESGRWSGRDQENMVDEALSPIPSQWAFTVSDCGWALSWGKIMTKLENERITSFFMFLIRGI